MKYLYLKQKEGMVVDCVILNEKKNDQNDDLFFHQLISDDLALDKEFVFELLNIKDEQGYYNNRIVDGLFVEMSEEEKNIANKIHSRTDQLEELALEQAYQIELLNIQGGYVS